MAQRRLSRTLVISIMAFALFGTTPATRVMHRHGLAGRSCYDSLQLLTGLPDWKHPKTYRASAGNTIVTIAEIMRPHAQRDSVNVIGFLYTTGNGALYYGPRTPQDYSSKLFRTQLAFLSELTKGKRAPASPNLARSSNALISVEAAGLRSALSKTSLTSMSCLAWPRGKPIPT